jgi:hypothetical protein
MARREPSLGVKLQKTRKAAVVDAAQVIGKRRLPLIEIIIANIIKSGRHERRPVYLFVRQVDDAKVWTSEMFITSARHPRSIHRKVA